MSLSLRLFVKLGPGVDLPPASINVLDIIFLGYTVDSKLPYICDTSYENLSYGGTNIVGSSQTTRVMYVMCGVLSGYTVHFAYNHLQR